MYKFMGFNIVPKSSYSHVATTGVHISSVALEDGSHSKLHLTVRDQKYLVGTLNKRARQLALNLTFNEGDQFMFENSGNGKLSLLGYQCIPNILAEESSSDTGSSSGSGSSTGSGSTASEDEDRIDPEWQQECQQEWRELEQARENYQYDEDEVEERHRLSAKRRCIE